MGLLIEEYPFSTMATIIKSNTSFNPPYITLLIVLIVTLHFERGIAQYNCEVLCIFNLTAQTNPILILGRLYRPGHFVVRQSTASL